MTTLYGARKWIQARAVLLRIKWKVELTGFELTMFELTVFELTVPDLYVYAFDLSIYIHFTIKGRSLFNMSTNDRYYTCMRLVINQFHMDRMVFRTYYTKKRPWFCSWNSSSVVLSFTSNVSAVSSTFNVQL